MNPYINFCSATRSSADWTQQGGNQLSGPSQGKLLGALYRSMRTLPPDLKWNLAQQLKDCKSLLNMCSTDQDMKRVCDQNEFWKNNSTGIRAKDRRTFAEHCREKHVFDQFVQTIRSLNKSSQSFLDRPRIKVFLMQDLHGRGRRFRIPFTSLNGLPDERSLSRERSIRSRKGRAASAGRPQWPPALI